MLSLRNVHRFCYLRARGSTLSSVDLVSSTSLCRATFWWAIDQEAHPGQRILDALDELMARGSAANWDGYGAPPVEPLAKAGAKHFIDLLGAKLPEPEVALAPGAITFDWYINPRWIFSVSVSDDRKVHYAGLFGTDKMSGTVELTGALPEIMELGIRRAASGVVAESH